MKTIRSFTGAVAIVAAVSAAAFSATSAMAQDMMAKIKEKGVLVVGVKADYKPFGFRDPSGGVVGLEPDLAANIAKRLGVKLELVPVVSANRMEFLKQGRIDLMIATMSDKPERRKMVQVIEPLYYSDSVNVLLAKTAPVKTWEDLKGKKICATTGAFYNKDVAVKYGPEILSFDGSEKPLLALKSGECIGYLYDQTFVVGKLLDDEWKQAYAMPLPGIMESPWAMAVGLGEDKFAAYLSDVTKEWMKTGFIVDLEKKWGVPPTDYSKRMNAQHKGA